MNSKTAKFTTFLIGIVVSALCLWLASRNIDKKLFMESLASINGYWLVLCGIGLLCGAVARSVRWRMLGGFNGSYQFNFTRATALGIFSNLILPARAGEAVKIGCAVKFTGGRLPRILASAICDRFVDLAVLLLVAVSMSIFTPAGQYLNKWVLSLTGIGALIVVVFVIFILNANLLDQVLSRLFEKWLAKWSVKPGNLLGDFSHQIHSAVGNICVPRVIATIAVVLVADYVVIGSMLNAFDLSLGLEVPLVLWVFLAAGSALPSAPGYIGIYQLAAVWTLQIYNVNPSISIALATALQLVTLMAIAAGTLTLEGMRLFLCISASHATETVTREEP